MVTSQFSEGISEVLDILKHMDLEYTEKIPKDFMDFLEENKSTTYIPELDHSKKIDEMELKVLFILIIGLISNKKINLGKSFWKMREIIKRN